MGHARLAAILTLITTAAAASVARTTWDRVYSEEQAVEGDAIYQERCATCHGGELEGGEDAPPLAGAQFSAIWEGRTLGDLAARMETMPKDAPGSLSREAYAGITANLLKRNGFPAGHGRLRAEREALDAIRYVTVAP